MINLSRAWVLGATAAVAAAAAPALAEFPDRPITIIVPYAPGGTPDIFARLLADEASRSIGQQVVVENRGGAGGNIGFMYGAQAAPDGYTITMCAFGCATNPHMYTSETFDPVEDFRSVVLVGTLPNVLLVHPNFPAQTVEELIAYARANPGEVTYASSGYGSSGHLSGALLEMSEGIELTHIPYQGQGAVVADMLSGAIDIFFNGIPPSVPHIQSGGVRALATTGTTRPEALPDLPTMQEAGAESFLVLPWMGLVVPAGTPDAVVEVLNTHFRRAVEDPGMARRFVEQGVTPGGGTPEDLDAFIASEFAYWGEVIRVNEIRVD